MILRLCMFDVKMDVSQKLFDEAVNEDFSEHSEVLRAERTHSSQHNEKM